MSNIGPFGQLPQAVLLITNLKEAEVKKHYPYLKPGGHWKPEDCTTEHKNQQHYISTKPSTNLQPLIVNAVKQNGDKIFTFINETVTLASCSGNWFLSNHWLKATKPRDILSIEQQQQNTVNKKSPVHKEKAEGNEKSVVELVQNDHEVILERIRSPDIDMRRNGTSTTLIVNMDDKPLVEDIPLFEELENRLLKNRSDDLKKICPDPEDNRKLIGQLPQAVLLITNLKEAEVKKHYPYLKSGGHWKPEDCTTEHKVS
ncbi:hypothetical protein WUBG_14268 [Wuchereria bancrofti]|uniref:Uncharacterized protein n=1 Tax=Wuchereria bancrofti TaxID=6293 RepID=J9EHE3_WUCBA|nr:hypothetical protein WUBG_14268 [Wuchereria bancrofti]